MKTLNIWRLTILALLELPGSVFSQTFNSGSDGSYGPMNITNSITLIMPTNGIFNCTTITIATGATLTFTRNTLNTPVYLLATGDIQIDGAISVSGAPGNGRVPGAGGPGGFDGGWGGYGGTGFGGTGQGSDGQGPGGGQNSYPKFSASFGTLNNLGAGSVYGNSLLVPLIGGSGGAGVDGNPGNGGGGGGGAICVSSSTQISINGQIVSYGGNGYVSGGGGSGGGIRLVAPLVMGSGLLRTEGGLDPNYGMRGGAGRSRIDCIDGNAVRAINTSGTVASRGVQMYVFPAIRPRLDVVQVAGQSIPIGTGSEADVFLPTGSQTTQLVVVKATGFTNDVSIVVAVVPSDRASTTYPTLISLTNNPATVSVPVNLAIDSTNRIMVWSR